MEGVIKIELDEKNPNKTKCTKVKNKPVVSIEQKPMVVDLKKTKEYEEVLLFLHKRDVKKYKDIYMLRAHHPIELETNETNGLRFATRFFHGRLRNLLAPNEVTRQNLAGASMCPACKSGDCGFMEQQMPIERNLTVYICGPQHIETYINFGLPALKFSKYVGNCENGHDIYYYKAFNKKLGFKHDKFNTYHSPKGDKIIALNDVPAYIEEDVGESTRITISPAMQKRLNNANLYGVTYQIPKNENEDNINWEEALTGTVDDRLKEEAAYVDGEHEHDVKSASKSKQFTDPPFEIVFKPIR